MARYFALLNVLALATSCLAQSETLPLPVDLTIALFDTTGNSCDAASNAPTIHVSGFQNTSEICVDLNAWINGTRFENGTFWNYTATNVQHFNPNTTFTQFWYQQLSGNTTQDQADNTLGKLALQTHPCSNCANSDCPSGDYPSKGNVQSNSIPYGSYLQWSCNAEGACYRPGYVIKSFTLRTAVDNYDSLDAVEQNDMCELAAVEDGNFTNNNNTDLHKGAGNALEHSISGVWTTVVGVVVGLLFVV